MCIYNTYAARMRVVKFLWECNFTARCACNAYITCPHRAANVFRKYACRYGEYSREGLNKMALPESRRVRYNTHLLQGIKVFTLVLQRKTVQLCARPARRYSRLKSSPLFFFFFLKQDLNHA